MASIERQAFNARTLYKTMNIIISSEALERQSFWTLCERVKAYETRGWVKVRFGAVHTDSAVERLPTVVPVGSITSRVLQPLRYARHSKFNYREQRTRVSRQKFTIFEDIFVNCIFKFFLFNSEERLK